MVERKYRFKSMWQDYVILILVLLAVGIFAYARISGQRVGTQDGIMTRRAVPSIMFKGERLNVELRLDAGSLPRCTLPPSSNDPVYAVMVMDTSGSMAGAPLASTQAAATEFVNLLDMDIDRVGLIKFDNGAQTLSGGFSTSREGIADSIKRLSAGGGTNMGAGLQDAYDMIQETSIPPQASRLLILLSDGMPNEGPDPASIAQQVRDDTGFRIIAIATGNADEGYLGTLVENPDEDVLVSSDPTGLVKTFGEIAKRYVNLLATDIEVHENYNSEAFDILPFSAPTADTSQSGTVRWHWSFLGDRGRNAGYQLRPRRMGRHQVTTESGNMSLVDCNEQTLSQTLPVGPSVLVLFPWWVLLLLGLLGLLWLIYRFLEEIRLGKVPYGPGAPAAPDSVMVPPMPGPAGRRSPTGDWHGKDNA